MAGTQKNIAQLALMRLEHIHINNMKIETQNRIIIYGTAILIAIFLGIIPAITFAGGGSLAHILVERVLKDLTKGKVTKE